MPKWTLDEAVAMVTRMEKYLLPCYHVALAGSVLHTGESDKDIDILIFPHTTTHHEIQEIHIRLDAFGMKLRVTNEKVREKWKNQGSTDTKYVEVWSYQGKRVDVFYPWTMRE